jgi:hypothetical protein
MQKGNSSEGKRLSVKAMEAQIKHLGPEHKDTLDSVEIVGFIYPLEGQWKEAVELGVQVIEMRKTVLGADHPSTLTSMGNLALIYMDQGRWNKAGRAGSAGDRDEEEGAGHRAS